MLGQASSVQMSEKEVCCNIFLKICQHKEGGRKNFELTGSIKRTLLLDLLSSVLTSKYARVYSKDGQNTETSSFFSEIFFWLTNVTNNIQSS